MNKSNSLDLFCITKSTIIKFLFPVFFSASLQAQIYTGTVFQPVEISFESLFEYSHPHRDVEIWAEFSNENGQNYRIAGFWDGGKTYRFRFAPPDTGLWHFRTFASDSTNSQLHHRTGQIHVGSASNQNAFSMFGWPRVSANGRYFTHANGKPIFLLSDSAWEIAWKSTDAEVDTYIANRKAKGFNAIQLVAMSHIYISSFGRYNQHNEPFVLNDDLSFLNPRYFDHLDRIVEKANEAGLLVEIVPLWGRIIEFVGGELGYDPAVKVDEALIWARYIGARYAGHNVMWIVAGDWFYDEPQQNAFWDQFGRVLQQASGKMHLTSIHTTGFFGSFSFYDENADWLDYYMYSVMHDTLNLGYNWIGAREGYQARPVKPVRNAESNYEDIPSRFWKLPSDSSQIVRIAPRHVRGAAYQSILSGSLVGFCYGANGVWQWSTEWEPSHLLPRFTAVQSLDFPGAFQMTLLKTLMERYDWFDFVPAQELLLEARLYVNESGHANLPIAKNQRYVLAYFPAATASATIATCGALPTDVYYWISPRDGIEHDRRQIASNALLELSPPDSRDWLLVIESGSIQAENCDHTGTGRTDDVLTLLGTTPNPYYEKTSLLFRLKGDGIVRVKIFDLLGKEVFTSGYHVAAGFHRVDVALQAAGVYFYRIRFEGEGGITTIKTGKMIQLGRQ